MVRKGRLFVYTSQHGGLWVFHGAVSVEIQLNNERGRRRVERQRVEPYTTDRYVTDALNRH